MLIDKSGCVRALKVNADLTEKVGDVLNDAYE